MASKSDFPHYITVKHYETDRRLVETVDDEGEPQHDWVEANVEQIVHYGDCKIEKWSAVKEQMASGESKGYGRATVRLPDDEHIYLEKIEEDDKVEITTYSPNGDAILIRGDITRIDPFQLYPTLDVVFDGPAENVTDKVRAVSASIATGTFTFEQ